MLLACGLFAAGPSGVLSAAAQSLDATSLTITPPFFTLNVAPGDTWSSAIRVVDTNPGPLPVTAQVMGFTAADDEGHGSFIKLSDLVNDPNALANWITLASSSATVPPNGAVDIPFTVKVPHDASPGGHYAGILIGTAPSSPAANAGSHVGVSSFISALIFVRVAGTVKEAGEIREFSTDKSFYQDPNVDFTLRFANTGNVHVRPVGKIQIYNAFGQEKGSISLNENGGLGYVLPSSTRAFEATWQNQGNLWDIGQYTAVVTLAYGENGAKNVSQTVTFWIIPVGLLVTDGLIALLIAGLFLFLLRRYVRKMLAREIGYLPPQKSQKSKGDHAVGHPHSLPPPPPETFDKGEKGVVDLRK